MSSPITGSDAANINRNLFELAQQTKITNELLRAILAKLRDHPKA